MRHDRRRAPLQPIRLRGTSQTFARQSRTRPVVGRSQQGRPDPVTPPEARSKAEGAAEKRLDLRKYAQKWRYSWARSAVRQPLHRGVAGRDERVWLFLHSGSRGCRQQDRAAPHQVAQRSARVVDRPARPRPRLPVAVDARVRAGTSRAAVGAAIRAAQPGGDDGPVPYSCGRVGGRRCRRRRRHRGRAREPPP